MTRSVANLGLEAVLVSVRMHTLAMRSVVCEMLMVRLAQ